MGSFDSKTDVKKRGLASATRSNKATRPLTRPAWSLQSSAEDLSPRVVTLQSASQLPQSFSPGAIASLLRCMARRPIRIQLRRAGQNRRVPARILT